MHFYSTRDPKLQRSFSQAIFEGLAPDGGLYVPSEVPNFNDLFEHFSRKTDFQEIAAQVIHNLIPKELNLDDSRTIAKRAFPFAPKLVSLDEKQELLELYHGPSCAFKDFGASFLATAMEHFLVERDERAIILTATSGDTGAAVAQAFHNKKSIEVVILYPSGRVSPSQEKQLTTVGDNVHALEVLGSFDDCQKMVKEVFVDAVFKEQYSLTSANSINLGRLIPQSFYYIWAYSQLKDRNKSIHFTVPSGNFGNLTAGLLAKLWGLPVDGFVAATNINDVVPKYLLNGKFKAEASKHTYSNAMDVGNPSNFERIEHIFRNDWKAISSLISGEVVTDEETIETMRRYHSSGFFLCPHTAVGVLASERQDQQKNDPDEVHVTLGTAHPAKFNEVVSQACGEDAPMPDRLGQFLRREKIATKIEPELAALKEYIQAKY